MKLKESENFANDLNPESKTVLDHFTWGDCFSTSGGSRGRIQGEGPGGPGPPISDLTLV